MNSQKEFNRLIDTLTDIINLSDNASDLSKQLQNPLLSPNEIQQKIDRIDKIDKKINQENSSVATLIKAYGFAEFSAFLTTKNTDDWDANHIHLMTINYYQAFKTVATQLLELAHDTQIRLSHRLNELSPNANLQELTEFWREEQQHGRINIWLENHSDKEDHQNLPSSSQLIKENGALIKTISDEYAEQLAITPKEYIDTVKESASMENVFEKIVVLIRDNDHHGLLKMTRNLKTLAENDDEAKRLYHLTYCHQLQLEHKDSEALQTLLALDEALQSEVELKQISLLALKTSNIDVAEFALAQLSSYSDEYIPQHAHILKLQGKFQESVTAYLDYLDKYSEDVTTWLKLGLFMIEVNELESAKTAFQHALQTDPNNQVAQEYLAQL